VVARHPVLGVEFEPGGAGVAVARLADAAGVEQPLAVNQLDLGAVRGLRPLGVATAGPFRPREEEGDVGVTDQPDPLLLGVEAGFGLVGREHVLPDRIAR